jgi:hypothetical protein
MNRYVFVKCTVIVAAIFGCSLARASTLPRADYDAEKIRIGNEYRARASRCGVIVANAMDDCAREAKFSEKVALADLEYRFTGTEKDRSMYMTVKAEADYNVAKEKCDVSTGKDKGVCMQQAKLARTNSLPYVKKEREAVDTHHGVAKNGQGPDFNVALKRCDIFDGDTKSACIISAKAKFGKS